MVGFLITTDLTSEQLDYVHTVQQSAEALLLVINDILDLSKVEAGMMKLEMEPFSIHAMVEGANELLSTLAIQKGLELGFLVEDDVPEIVVGDRVRLRQVLINIIGVSCKQQWFLLMSFLFL
jgi:signal transduction histidine kinase